MGIFSRRRSLPAAQRAGVAVDPFRSAAGGAHGPAGTVGIRGHAGLGVQHPSQYLGGVSGTALTTRPGMVPGLQRRCGTESLNAGWYCPPNPADAATAAPFPWMATQRAGYYPGSQRSGSTVQGGMGPVNAQAMRAGITRAQILQSGLGVVQWARQRPPTVGA